MSRRNLLASSPVGLLSAVVTIVLLAGCTSVTAIPPQTVSSGSNALASFGSSADRPDISVPPKCKGQKNTKLYAEVATQNVKTAGGSLCVPAFGGWGGALQYPDLKYSQSFTIQLISSTKAYASGKWPPNGSQTPIFYLQYAFSGFPTFGSTLPKGSPMVSSHLLAGKAYTVQLWENVIVGWTDLGSCYVVAQKSSKYGGQLAKVGGVFDNVFYREASGVLEIFKGQFASNKCM
jgi:hypothetical protein